MSATEATTAPPAATQTPAPEKRWYRKGITWAVVFAGFVAIVVAAIIAGALTQLAHPAATAAPKAAATATAPATPASPAPAEPATADAVLARDGYALVQDMPAESISGTSGMVTSAALGAKPDGTDELVVITSTPGTATLLTGIMASSAAQSGASVTASGSVVRVVGTMEQLGGMGDALNTSPPTA